MEESAVKWLREEIKKFNTVITKEYLLLLIEQAEVMEEQAKVEFAFKAYSKMLSTGKSFVDIVNSMRTFKSE